MTSSNGERTFALEDPDAAPSPHNGLPVVVIGAGPVRPGPPPPTCWSAA